MYADISDYYAVHNIAVYVRLLDGFPVNDKIILHVPYDYSYADHAGFDVLLYANGTSNASESTV